MSLKKLEAKHRVDLINSVVDKIYILESSGGKNDGYCKNQGGYNGYGYRQNKHEMVCFDTHDRVRGYVTEWVTQKLEVMSLAQAMCYYNRGLKVNDCPYWQNFKSLR